MLRKRASVKGFKRQTFDATAVSFALALTTSLAVFDRQRKSKPMG